MLQKFKMTTFAAVLGLFGFVLFSAAPFAGDFNSEALNECLIKMSPLSRRKHEMVCHKDHATNLLEGSARENLDSTVCQGTFTGSFSLETNAIKFTIPGFTPGQPCTIGVKSKMKFGAIKLIYQPISIGKTLNPTARLERCHSIKWKDGFKAQKTSCYIRLAETFANTCHAPMDRRFVEMREDEWDMEERDMQEVDIIAATLTVKHWLPIGTKKYHHKELVKVQFDPCTTASHAASFAGLPKPFVAKTWCTDTGCVTR